MPTAIEFNHVSKEYRLGLVSTRTLSHDLGRWWQMHVLGKEDPYLKIGSVNDRSKAADSDFVWALKDIDFKVEQGDVVGIIGKNGAGKSTLLKLLSRVTTPTTGTIKARGRIASLLEVGTGFHTELTGRENIYMNGAILGMTKNEIDRKIDEIVDFSGCERYIDTPVKRYSSGMKVRLGFAVAAYLDPEILVVDEVLAVGDAEFQKKAIGKMQDISKGEGRTVLFVSHNMQSVRSLCNHGVLLNNGQIQYAGDMEDVVNCYLQNTSSDFKGYNRITAQHQVPNLDRRLEYVDVKMENDVENVSTEEPLSIVATVRRNDVRITQCQFGIVLIDNLGKCVGGGYSAPVSLPEGTSTFPIKIVLKNHQLARGIYHVNLNIAIFDYKTSGFDYDIVRDVLSFRVDYLDQEHRTPFNIWSISGRCAYQDLEAMIVD